MTADVQENQSQNQKQDFSANAKENNFRLLQEKYERELQKERSARADAEKLAKEAMEKARVLDRDDEEDSEPYVDNRKLEKKLSKFGESTQSEIQKAMEAAKAAAKEELKQEMWLDSNPDFYDVLQHADKFAEKAPELAKTILKMPEGFERQKMVYQTIKHLKIDQPEPKQSTIQETIDAKRRTPFYQPTGVGTAPYAQSGDFSDMGKKQAYEKMVQLRSNLRLG